jgi:hypothetical protein
MHRGVNRDYGRPPFVHPIGAALAPVGGSVVHDPENPSCGAVRLLAHNLINQPLERNDPALALTTSIDLGPTHFPRRYLRPGAYKLILVFHSHRNAG